MSSRTARQVQMVSRPAGMPDHGHFKLVEVELPAPAAGEVLVENRYMSVDPYMRGRMRADAVYAAPFALDKPMYGGAVGEVVESADDSLEPGDIVLNFNGWQDRFIARATQVQRFDPFDRERISLYLGALGMPGMTAHVGLLKFGEPKAGETVFVSAASGAVGAIVCQIAKMKGCRVVGSVGSDAKAAWLKGECGVDETINYRTCGSLTRALRDAAPDGVDVYFENVGGDHLQAAINAMNPFGRIAACGMISGYNQSAPEPGPNNLMYIVGKKLRIQGFIISDHEDMRPAFERDMSLWIREGKIQTRETVYEGIENAVDAFLALFTGENFGKMVVKL
ncbi:MAG: NADP-dependent oxidoreductase [Gammaproteobacteria bacterium]|nr:NADP-dependent oxidoreductase [Gammaproteobacteria bacterium]